MDVTEIYDVLVAFKNIQLLKLTADAKEAEYF